MARNTTIHGSIAHSISHTLGIETDFNEFLKRYPDYIPFI